MNAADADQLKNIFNDIWTAISSKPSSPIATTTESGMERGTVTHGEQTDTVSVQVPEQLLPLRLYSATVDQNGAVSTTINDTFPIRVFYSVVLKDGVEEALANPDEALAAYIAANGETQTGANGNVYVPAGTVRMGLANYTVAKKSNVTATATAAIAPRWDGTAVNVALGNNGRLAFAEEPAVPTPEPSEPAASAQPEAPATDAAPQAPASESPANTGSNVALIVCIAAALLCAGLGTLKLARRGSTGRHAG